MTSEQVLADMDRQNLRPATAWELFTLGAQRHNLPQKGIAIIALGTVVQVLGVRYVSGLHHIDSGRSLDLDWFDYEWYEGYRFAAVRR